MADLADLALLRQGKALELHHAEVWREKKEAFLARQESGIEPGFCIKCHHRIEKKRLLAIPDAILCCKHMGLQPKKGR